MSTQFSLAPTTFEEALRFASMVAKSDLAPKDFKNKPESVLIAMQMGYEAGLNPMQSIQNIAVINGRPCLWGDALLALVQNHPKFEYIKESDDGHTATCIVKRKGSEEHVVTFSMDDAQQANLLGKPGPWKQYPKRMRQMRARGFALRDQFSDALKGFNSAEEVSDYNSDDRPIKNVTPQTEITKISSDRPSRNGKRVEKSEYLTSTGASEVEITVNEAIEVDPTQLEEYKAQLDTCKTLDELKNIWLGLAPEYQKELVEVKNQAKTAIIENEGEDVPY